MPYQYHKNNYKMKLYYTTIKGQDQIQNEPYLSLGGYKSASLVSNNTLGNMFDAITSLTIANSKEREYIGLILKNETDTRVENLWLWFEFPEKCYSKFRVAAVNLSSDENDVPVMEHIPTRNSQPSFAEFHEADGIENAVLLGNLDVGAMIGLWFERQLLKGLADIVTDEKELYEVHPQNPDLVRPIIQETIDEIKICMLWGSEYYGSPIGEDLI